MRNSCSRQVIATATTVSTRSAFHHKQRVTIINLKNKIMPTRKTTSKKNPVCKPATRSQTPLQELTLDTSFWPFPKGEEEKFRFTVRYGKRDIRKGKLLFKGISQGQPTGQKQIVGVTKVVYTTLRQLRATDAFKDEGATVNNTKRSLKPFYKELTEDSDISVIYFTV